MKIPFDIFKDINPYINVSDLPQGLNTILEQLSTEGKPFSQIKLEAIKFNETDTVQANFSLEESNKRILDDIVIRGFDKFPRAFLKNYAGLKKGNIFDREKLD